MQSGLWKQVEEGPTTLLWKLLRHLKRIVSPPNPVIAAVRAFTMLTTDRLESLMRLSTEVTRKGLPGAFVECGTCRGGSAAVLAWAAKQEGWKRDLYLFDSFQGHPASASEEAPDREEVAKWAGTMVASQEDVRAALRSVDAYAPEHVNIVPGWFQESIPTVSIPQIAVLHIDADWYDSVSYCLEALYDKVVSGGYIVIDDYYYYEGCRLAVDEFLANRESEVKRSAVGVAIVLRRVQGESACKHSL